MEEAAQIDWGLFIDFTKDCGFGREDRDVLQYLLKKKIEGKNIATAKELIEKADIKKAKIYTVLGRLEKLGLVRSSWSKEGHCTGYRVEGRIADVMLRLKKIMEDRLDAEAKERESRRNALRKKWQDLSNEFRHKIIGAYDMDYYEIFWRPEKTIHAHFTDFLETMVEGDEVLAITPTAIVWSVPKDEIEKDQYLKEFKNVFAEKLRKKAIKARYICFLDRFKEKSKSEVLQRLNTLEDNLQHLPNLTLADASRNLRDITGSPTLTIFGCKSVVVGLKGPITGRIEKALVFTDPIVVNFYRDLFNTVFRAVMDDNLLEYFDSKKVKSLLRKKLHSKVNSMSEKERRFLLVELLNRLTEDEKERHLKDYILYKIKKIKKSFTSG
jgi:DNA-binding PadR family transcriptional regulator